MSNDLQNQTTVTSIGDLVMDLEPDATAEQVAHITDRLDWLKGVVRELDKQHKQKMLAWLEQNGELTIGTVRWYVGTKKKTRVRDHNAALNTLLEATGGDVEKIADCLAANALKPGACRTVLGDELYDQVFETIVEKVPETGKPRREAVSADTRFLPNKGK